MIEDGRCGHRHCEGRRRGCIDLGVVTELRGFPCEGHVVFGEMNAKSSVEGSESVIDLNAVDREYKRADRSEGISFNRDSGGPHLLRNRRQRVLARKAEGGYGLRLLLPRTKPGLSEQA